MKQIVIARVRDTSSMGKDLTKIFGIHLRSFSLYLFGNKLSLKALPRVN
jgi:hypothetical protein